MRSSRIIKNSCLTFSPTPPCYPTPSSLFREISATSTLQDPVQESSLPARSPVLSLWVLTASTAPQLGRAPRQQPWPFKLFCFASYEPARKEISHHVRTGPEEPQIVH